MTGIGHAATVKRGVMIGAASLKTTLTNWCRRMDMKLLDSLARALTTLPLKTGESAMASAPFDLPISFPDTDAARWKFYLDAMTETKAKITELGNQVPSLTQTLQTAVTNDAGRVAVIQQYFPQP